MPKNTQSTIRSGLRVFDPEYELLPGEASLDGFHLAPPAFTPQKSGELLDDGVPVTRLGDRYRDAIAAHNGIEPADVPHGLIRLIEATSANDRANERALSQVRPLRNRLGHLMVVPFLFLSPVVLPWLINGRAHQRLARHMRKDQYNLLTQPRDHELLHLPVMDVESVEQVLAHYEAQRHILGLHAASGADREFLEDIAWNGVLQEVVVAPTYLANGNAGSWTAQAIDGARRITGTHELQRKLTGESPAIFQRAWADADMKRRSFRELDADAVVRLHEATTYPNYELDLFPSSSSDEARARFVDFAESSMEMRIFQRIRTVPGLLVLAARPNALGGSYHQVLLEDVRARHIKGAQAEPWDDAAVRAQTTIGAIEQLAQSGVMSDRERHVALGNATLPWSDDPAASPAAFRNRLAGLAHLIGVMTTAEHRNALNEHLRMNHQWPNNVKRGRAVADQMLVVIEREDDERQGDQIASAMTKLIQNARWYRTEEHHDRDVHTWGQLVGEDIEALLQLAKDDLASPHHGADVKVEGFGAARRALGMLGGLALMVNPALVDHEYEDGNRGGQLSQSARGGRLRYEGPSLPEGDAAPVYVLKADPGSVVSRMLRKLDGLEQLAIAVRALTSGPVPEAPRVPETGELMDDAYLRFRWLGTEGSDLPPIDEPPADTYARLVARFFETLGLTEQSAEEVRSFAVPLDVDEGEDDDEPTGRPLFLDRGLTQEEVEEGKRALTDLQEFVVEAGFIRKQRGE